MFLPPLLRHPGDGPGGAGADTKFPAQALVDRFVIVSFFLEKHCIPQYYR